MTRVNKEVERGRRVWGLLIVMGDRIKRSRGFGDFGKFLPRRFRREAGIAEKIIENISK